MNSHDGDSGQAQMEEMKALLTNGMAELRTSLDVKINSIETNVANIMGTANASLTQATEAFRQAFTRIEDLNNKVNWC